MKDTKELHVLSNVVAIIGFGMMMASMGTHNLSEAEGLKMWGAWTAIAGLIGHAWTRILIWTSKD